MIEPVRIEPEALYDGASLRQALGLTSASPAAARRARLLRITSQGKRTLYKGASWLRGVTWLRGVRLGFSWLRGARLGFLLLGLTLVASRSQTWFFVVGLGAHSNGVVASPSQTGFFIVGFGARSDGAEASDTPRRPRIEFEGAIHHAMVRRSGRRKVVRDHAGRRRLIEGSRHAVVRYD